MSGGARQGAGRRPVKIDVEQPLNLLGVDSLMAVELINRIESDLAVDVPVLKVIEGASLRQLASFLVDRLVPIPSLATDAFS